MKIVILHGRGVDARDIPRCLGERESVVLTMNHHTVRRTVMEAESHREGVFVVATAGGLTPPSHNTIVELINRRGPSQFFLYASRNAERLHGLIPRQLSGEDHTLLASILTFVAEAEELTIERLVEAFPDVTSNLEGVK